MNNQNIASESVAVENPVVFHIPIAGTRVKKHQVTAMHLIAGLLLIVMGLITFATPYAIGIIGSSSTKQPVVSIVNYLGLVFAVFGLALIIITTFFNKKIIQTKANFVLRIIEIIAFLSILFYSLVQKWYLPAAYSGAALIGIILAYFLEKGGQSSRSIVIDDNGIKIPGRINNLPWQNIKAVIFKHNLITIDCKDNKFFQLTFFKEALENQIPLIEAFAKGNMEKKGHLYQSYW